jgi:hypothetical protein
VDRTTRCLSSKRCSREIAGHEPGADSQSFGVTDVRTSPTDGPSFLPIGVIKSNDHQPTRRRSSFHLVVGRAFHTRGGAFRTIGRTDQMYAALAIGAAFLYRPGAVSPIRNRGRRFDGTLLVMKRRAPFDPSSASCSLCRKARSGLGPEETCSLHFLPPTKRPQVPRVSLWAVVDAADRFLECSVSNLSVYADRRQALVAALIRLHRS